MKFTTLLKLMRFWPPFLGAGIKVKEYHPNGRYIIVEMKMRFWNKNYVGTHFGGSLYSMTDPFYMLMLLNVLGKGYMVWDKAASIRYKIPARGSVFATFELSEEQIEKLQKELDIVDKIEPEFIIPIKDKEGKTIAEVKKIIHIAKKKQS